MTNRRKDEVLDYYFFNTHKWMPRNLKEEEDIEAEGLFEAYIAGLDDVPAEVLIESYIAGNMARNKEMKHTRELFKDKKIYIEAYIVGLEGRDVERLLEAYMVGVTAKKKKVKHLKKIFGMFDELIEMHIECKDKIVS